MKIAVVETALVGEVPNADLAVTGAGEENRQTRGVRRKAVHTVGVTWGRT